jgi:hypothetical protein
MTPRCSEVASSAQVHRELRARGPAREQPLDVPRHEQQAAEHAHR